MQTIKLPLDSMDGWTRDISMDYLHRGSAFGLAVYKTLYARTDYPPNRATTYFSIINFFILL